jgi:hypothetical protein
MFPQALIMFHNLLKDKLTDLFSQIISSPVLILNFTRIIILISGPDSGMSAMQASLTQTEV